MRRAARILTTLWWMTVLLAAPPLVLLRLTGRPWPSQPPGVGLAGTPATRQVIIGAAALAGWLTWVVFLGGVAARAGRSLTRMTRHLPRIRPFGPLQGLSATVLGTVTVTSTVAGIPAAAHATVATAIVPTAATGARVHATVAANTAITVRVGDQHYTTTVRAGDTLWHIADRWLGDPRRWPEIYRLNRNHYDLHGRMRHGDHIEPGWVLTLPTDALPPGHTGVNPAPDATAGGGGGAPGPSSAPNSAAAATPSRPSAAPSVTATDREPARLGPAATPAGSADTRSASADTAPAAPTGARSGSRPRGGVDLPGGWVPAALAAALLAAAAVVWRRRRRRYIPATPAGPVLRDPDLQPLPPAVTVLRRGLRRHAPDLLPTREKSPPSAMDPDGTPDVEQPPAAQDNALPPIGPSGPALAGLTAAIPASGLGLTGDGAPAATRALMVATLSSGSAEDPDARGQVVIPVDALTTLLGVDAVQLREMPRLSIAPNLSEALTRLEELLIERRRLLQDEDADDLASMRAADPLHPPMPPILLLAEVPGPEARARLTTALHLGTPLQINAVLLGEWPRGETVDVDVEGYTDTADPQRLGVLDTTTTLQLLQMLREAHTGAGTAEPAAEPLAAENDPTGHPAPGPAAPGDQQVVAGASAPQRGDHMPDLAAVPLAAAEGPGPDPAVPAHPTPTAGEPSRRVRVRVLGTPTIAPDGMPGDGLRTRARELLVYLVVHRSGADLPDIKEALWPDATVRRAGERLQTEVGDLRGRIRDAAGDNTVQPVVNTGGRYHLNPDLVEVDWWTVQDALTDATAATTTGQQITDLCRAVAAHHGPLADGFSYDWLPTVQEHVRRQGIIARARLAELLTDTDPAGAAGILDDATRLDPYNEDLARRAMRAHARLGDADAIHRQQQRLRSALDELDLEPDDRTRHLAAQLLREIGARRRPPPRPEADPEP